MVLLLGWIFSAAALIFLPTAVFTVDGVLRRLHRLFLRQPWGPVVPRDKVVLVTGASSGIGQQIAIEYARRGAKVVLVARRVERLQQVEKECRDHGANAVAIFPSDVSREENCKRMVDFAIQTFGRLDILVNNAGTTHSVLFEDSKSMADCAHVMDVDFWGNINTTLYALEHLHQTQGQIIVVSSVAAYIPYPYLTFYTAAKGAIVNFYDTLRVENYWGKKNVSITIAFPGFVRTELTEREPPGHIPKWLPLISADIAAMAIVEAAVQRRRYVVVPGWYLTSLFYRIFASEILTWWPQLFILGPARKKNKAAKIIEEGKDLAKQLHLSPLLSA